MDPDLKTKWVEALRSGRYRQRHGFLRHEGGYCCLGVLADLIDPDGFTIYGTGWHRRREPDGHPLPIAETGLGGDDQKTLVELNDKTKLPFPGIAAWIEEHVP